MHKTIVLAVAAMALALPAGAAETLDETPRIAVMSAFAPEWVALQEALSDRVDYTLRGITLASGTIEGKPVVLFLTGSAWSTPP